MFGVEFVLHVSYRLDLKKWKVAKENKLMVTQRKRKIQDAFLDKMGLKVDFPRSSGPGTSNDGNTSRRAFRDAKTFSKITGVCEEFIQRLANILCAINSFQKINVIKFGEYCRDTCRIYLKNYNWYYMPASVHKLLIHGPEVIERFMLPIGMFSEEAQESRNKDNKHCRLNHARKDSRLHTMQDQFRYLLVTSDPLVSTIIIEGERSKKPKLKMNEDALSLLDMPSSIEEDIEERLEEDKDSKVDHDLEDEGLSDKSEESSGESSCDEDEVMTESNRQDLKNQLSTFRAEVIFLMQINKY